MTNKKSKPQWKNEIDLIHQKHLNNIQTDGINGLAFHYTSPTGLLGILSQKSLWFSDCDYLNDSSESDYFLDIFTKTFNKENHSGISWNMAFRTYVTAMFHSKSYGWERAMFSRESERRYVCSLSIDEDTLPLWNNYTKTIDSTGYNIGFNIEKLTNTISLDSNQKLLIGRVIYSKKRQNSLLKELLDDYILLYTKYKYSYQRKYLYAAMEDNILVYSVFMKDPAFTCENEYRIAIFERGPISSDLSFREKNGAFMPYITKPIDLESIVSIMISPTTRADFVRDSVSSMSKHFGIADLEIKNSNIPLRY